MHHEIILNAVICLRCNKTLHSTHRHDFAACEHIFTDGGHDYLHRGGNPEDMKDISIFRDRETGEIIYAWEQQNGPLD